MYSIVDLHGAKRDDIHYIEATLRRCRHERHPSRLLPNLPTGCWASSPGANREDVPICPSPRWSISLAITFSREEIVMKLYMHPVSMTSRPVRLFIAENKIPVDEVTVDLFTGEHMKPPYSDLNPNSLVPMIEDGDFRLTESSAILKYLADKVGSPAYPKDLKARARVNERMDWINTQMCRDFAYGYVYPQIFPFHKRRSDEAQDATLAWGKERAQGWL